MATPVDQAARDQALDPARSFIVQAPAGSGKTGLLIRRFLILLAHVNKPEEILAITFTRKATAEMRHRVISALKQQKEDGTPEDDQALLALSNAALKNDQKHQWQLTNNSGRLRIQTIDSFCSELVNRMPWSARFGAPPSIVEDPMPLLRQAALRTLSRIEHNNDPALANACGNLISLMDARLDGAVDQLAAMLARRDQWMRLSIDHSRENIEDWWQQTINETLANVDRLFPAKMKHALAELAAFAADNLREINADKGKVSPIESCSNIRFFPSPDYSLLDQWRGIATMLTTQSGTIRSRIDKNCGFPPTKKLEKEKLKEILTTLSEDSEAAILLSRVLTLPDPKLEPRQWQDIESIIKVLPIAAAELRVLFTETNQADYIELGQRAEFALGSADQPTDLALVFDHRIQHLMVDEFQDTSAGQLSLLQKLLAGWQPDDGRSAFFVGDPMQSIYRFREAEVANFLDVQSNGIADVMPTPLKLETNFRSEAAVVDWCNDAFKVIMPSSDDRVLGAVRYAPANPFWQRQSESEVAVHPAIDSDELEEALEIVNLVETELKRDADQTIAILGRTRRSLEPIATSLVENNILFDAVNLQKLGERQVIQDMLALTCALIQPADRSAWLGILRAPWCGLSLKELTALCGENKSKPILQILSDSSSAKVLPSERHARLEKLTEVMTNALEAVGRQPLWRTVEVAWLKLDGPATMDAADLENCTAYLSMLEQLEADDTYISNATLDTALEKLWAAGTPSASVKLMTIHGSKGLEFDTVILPGLHRPTRGNNPDLIRFRHLPDRLLIAAKPSSIENEDTAYQFLGALEKESLKNETSRLLYVACTRARTRLHLFGTVKTKTDGALSSPVSNSLLSLLWPIVEEHFIALENQPSTPDPISEDEEDDTDLIDHYPLERIPSDWKSPDLNQSIQITTASESTEADSDAIEFDWAGEVARICGIVVHQIFQQIDVAGWENWRQQDFDQQAKHDCRNHLIENGLPVTLHETAISIIERALTNTRADKNAAWIFNPAHQSIRSEWPITGVINDRIQHAFIDRYFIAHDDDGNPQHWIVDFKTSRHEEAENLEEFIAEERNRYAETMRKYASIVRELSKTTEAPIKTALYFPVLKRLEVLN